MSRAPPIAGVDGNWSCSSCQNVNFAARSVCNRCAAPKPRSVIRPGGGSGKGGPVAGVDGNWVCPACQNVNYAMREVCNRCQMTKPVEDPSGRGRLQGGPLPGVDGNWACSLCGNVNWAMRDACNRCQTPKEEAVAESTLQAHVEPPSLRPGRPVAGVDGNWACALCNNVNFAMRDACNRCQTPKHEAEAPVQVHTEPAQMTAHGRSPPVAGVDGNWVCALCANVNYAMRDACNRCQTPKEDAEQPLQMHAEPLQMTSGKPMAGVDGNWQCAFCQNVNLGFRQACNRCQIPREEAETPLQVQEEPQQMMTSGHGRAGPLPGVDGNWQCGHCKNVNYAMRQACNRCQTPKEEAEAHAEVPELDSGHGGYSPGRGPPIAGMDGNWQCAHCRNINFAVRQACNRCQAPREEIHQPPVVVPWTQSPDAGKRGHRNDNGYQATKPNPQIMSGSGRGGPVAGVDGNWACSMCNNVNYGIRDACNRCQAPRPKPQVASGRGSSRGGSAIGAGPAAAGIQAIGAGPAVGAEVYWAELQGSSSSPRGGPVAGLDGNWACAHCGNVNWAVRDFCNRCSAPKHDAEAPTVVLPTQGPGVNWTCPQCQNINFPHRTICNRCQAPMPSARPSAKAPAGDMSGNWTCPRCQNDNYPHRTVCNRCQEPRPSSPFGGSADWGTSPAACPSRARGLAPVAGVDGNWACPTCQNVNFAMRAVCNLCSEPKPEEDPQQQELAELWKSLEEEEVVDDCEREEPAGKRIKLQD